MRTPPVNRRMVPMGFVLLKHDDDTVVLRCESPEAVGGFYNVDRVPNPSAPEVYRLRKFGQGLSRGGTASRSRTTRSPPNPPSTRSPPNKNGMSA
jgi:hypothetical protein